MASATAAGGPSIVQGAADSFRLVAGLAGGGSVSVQSCGDPSSYLRLSALDQLVYIDSQASFTEGDGAAYAEQASWLLQGSLWFPGFVALASLADPPRYLRHQGYRLKGSLFADTQLFKADGSWKLDASGVGSSSALQVGGPCMTLAASNYPRFSWGPSGRIVQGSTETFRLVMGVDGQPDTVSVQSCSSPDMVYALPASGTAMQLVDMAGLAAGTPAARRASFLLRSNLYLPGFFSLESSFQANTFVRHASYILQVEFGRGGGGVGVSWGITRSCTH